MGGEFGIHVYIWLSPFPVHLKLHNIINWLDLKTKVKKKKKTKLAFQINKLIEKEIRWWVTRGERRREGNWRTVGQRYRLSVINKYWGNITYGKSF